MNVTSLNNKGELNNMDIKGNEQFEELVIDNKDLQPGDQVFGTDGKWHDVEILPIHVPETMFEIEFSNGIIKCSGDHQWTLFDHVGTALIISTDTMYDERKDFVKYKFNFGKANGPVMVDIRSVKPMEVRCVSLKDSDDMLFEVFTDKDEPIFTHNCQQRLICGQLGSIASRMALDDNQATTIDGTHKGAGMTKSQGIVSNIQFYFEQQSWLIEWFKNRGLTKTGYEPHEDPNAAVDPSTINLGEDEDITIEKQTTTMDFNKIHKEVDNSKNQKFEEV